MTSKERLDSLLMEARSLIRQSICPGCARGGYNPMEDCQTCAELTAMCERLLHTEFPDETGPRQYDQPFEGRLAHLVHCAGQWKLGTEHTLELRQALREVREYFYGGAIPPEKASAGVYHVDLCPHCGVADTNPEHRCASPRNEVQK